MIHPALTFVLAIYGVMSVVTFVAFGVDKRAAERRLRRTPEKTLHLLELLGGWPGGLLAMAFWRHKNRKVSYIVVVVGIVALHAAGWWLAIQ